MTLEEIIQKFNNAKKIKPNSYQCCCPTHNDKKASLTITASNNIILLHCHAGCATKDIIKKVGLNMSDLYNNKNRKIYNNKINKLNIEKEYFYKNINNEISYKSIRCTDKQFYPARICNNKWVYNLDNVERIPYNLPNVVKSEDIYWVEGEKDADNLNRIGLTATTTIRRSIRF